MYVTMCGIMLHRFAYRMQCMYYHLFLCHRSDAFRSEQLNYSIDTSEAQGVLVNFAQAL